MLIVSSLLLNQNLPLLSHLHLLGLQGNILEGGDVSGALCFSQAWPGMARTIYGDHQRFVDAYFKAYPGELANVGYVMPLHLLLEPYAQKTFLRSW